MAVRRKDGEFWTEVQRIIFDENGDPQVKVTSCCCGAPGGMRRVCARAMGNKTPCRCYCHSTAD